MCDLLPKYMNRGKSLNFVELQLFNYKTGITRVGYRVVLRTEMTYAWGWKAGPSR